MKKIISLSRIEPRVLRRRARNVVARTIHSRAKIPLNRSEDRTQLFSLLHNHRTDHFLTLTSSDISFYQEDRTLLGNPLNLRFAITDPPPPVTNIVPIPARHLSRSFYFSRNPCLCLPFYPEHISPAILYRLISLYLKHICCVHTQRTHNMGSEYLQNSVIIQLKW
jgi:hypothetical protein